MTLATGLVTAMFILLATFNHKPVPDWGYSLSLGTILALMSTLYRSLVVFIASQIISQEKWTWYSDGRIRPLRHLQYFDAGSRGVVGSASLIPIVAKHNPKALAAAFLLIISFLIGPFVQQAVQTLPCSSPSAGKVASLPYAHYVPREGGFMRGVLKTERLPDSSTKLAIYSSLTNPNGADNKISATCITGNCTFPDGDPIDPIGPYGDSEAASHSTIALCHRCIDVSSLIEYSGEPTTNISLPNGFHIEWPSDLTVVLSSSSVELSWMGNIATQDFLRAARWSFANVTVLAITDSNDIPDVAATCVLYPCVRTYTASVTNNVLSEQQIDISLAVPDLANGSVLDPAALGVIQSRNGRFEHTDIRGDPYHFTAVKTPCRYGDLTYTAQNISDAPDSQNVFLYDMVKDDGSYGIQNISAPESCIYRQDARFGAAISSVLEDTVFNESCLALTGGSIGCAGTATRFGYERWWEALYSDGNATFQSINSNFDSFANAMTARYRTTFGSSAFDPEMVDAYNGKGDPVTPAGEVNGVVWDTTVCVHVQWKWLLFPVIFAALTLALLGQTLVNCWKLKSDRPVWKESLLPLLFYHNNFQQTSTSVTDALCDQRESSISANVSNKAALERSDMERLARDVLVSFQWPEITHGQHVCAKRSMKSGVEGIDQIGLEERKRLRRKTANEMGKSVSVKH